METQIQAKINPFLQVFTLAHEVVIIVPSTVNAIESVDNTLQVNHVAGELSKLFGGATITSGQGCWNSDKEGLIKESVTLVSSSCEVVNFEAVYNLAIWLKESMTQEAIAVKIDGVLYLV